MLLTSFWEAYCEDIAAEGLQHLVTHARTAAALPLELRKQVAKELKRELNEVAVWDLADDGWRAILNARLARLQQDRNRKLNAPKTAKIDELFHDALGIEKVSASWHWDGMLAEQARTELDKLVTLRGEIAHRGRAASGVQKSHVQDYYLHVKTLAAKTGGRVKGSVKKATAKDLW